jgi:hypothetical protein
MRIDDRDDRILQELRRHHLRHPGAVNKRIIKLLHQDSVTFHQILAARLEHRNLGLHLSNVPPSGGSQ